MNTKYGVERDGIVPVIPTPFDSDDQIDWSAMRQLLDFASSAGVSALCLPAYASEFYKLSEHERRQMIATAAEHVDERVPLIAQANCVSAAQPAGLARFTQSAGAAAVAVAAPRQFAVAERDLLRYFDRVLLAIDVPLLVQDFNPGGPTVSSGFIAQLHRQHPHFRWIKVEEPMMAAHVASILEETSGEVGVLEGWGGMYLLELLPAGICGVMPGLGVADLLAHVCRLAKAGNKQEAYGVLQGVLPQIVFSRQNMELYHHAEKRLLAARGIIGECAVRELAVDLYTLDADHIDFLNANILSLLNRLGIARCPRALARQYPGAGSD